MNSVIASFVIQAVRPEALKGGSAAIACPEFCNEYESWVEALLYAERIQSQMLLLLAVERAPWKRDIPKRAADLLESRLRTERAGVEALDQELILCLDLFAHAKLTVIPLKGMDVGRRFYPERILRPVWDIKLLAPPGSSHDALRVLGKGGYRLVGGSFPADFRVQLTRQGNSSVLALHTRLLPGDTDELMAELWDRAQMGGIPGLPPQTQALRTEDCLVYLVRHCALQTLGSPVWLNDIHYLIMGIQAREMDWDQITWNLAHAHSLSAAWLIFSLLSSEWGTKIPPEVPIKIGKKIGLIRRRLLAKLSRPQEWFSFEQRTFPQQFKSKYLLRDNAIQGLRAALNRD